VDNLRATLTANPDTKIVAFVHAETSTGAQSDAGALCAVAQEFGCLTIVDTVTSLGGVPVEVDAWGADAVYSGSQKCLSCTPGISPVTVSARAVEKIQARTTKVQSWFLDLNLVMGYWGGGGKRAYHHTAPINPLYALHESLVMLQEEGHTHNALRAGLEAMGIGFLVAAEHRLPQLNSVWVPEGVDEAVARGKLLNQYNLEIGAGLGDFAGKVWRIGLMGYSARPENVLTCLSSLEAVLGQMNAPINRGQALPAAHSVLFG
jgi:alanine-glyoxylate transaminase/serine-glyoxylate transaminase/serine-pyruvate transaminase